MSTDSNEREQPDEKRQVDWEREPLPLYCNGAFVSHSGAEFALVLTEELLARENGAHRRAVASLRMAPDTFFRIAAAMASNWNEFTRNNVEEGAPVPRFQGVHFDLNPEVDDGPSDTGD